MGYYYQPYKKTEIKPKTRLILKIVGLILLLISVFLLILSILGFTGVLSLSVGVWCSALIAHPFVSGLVCTIIGWNSKVAIYSRRGGHFEEAPAAPAAGQPTVDCPNCGTANGSDSSFCKQCGKPLNLSAVCPHCNAKVDGGSKYCPQCGRPIFDNGEAAEDLNNKHTEVYGGDEHIDFDKAKEFYVRGEYTKAVELFKILATQGDAEAQNGVGACYDNGQGVPQNSYEAVKWFNMAADQGYAKAQYNLGICYMNGRGVSGNLNEAVKWFKKAAGQGLPEAISVLQKLGYNNAQALNNMEQAVDNTHQAVSQIHEIDLNHGYEEKSLLQRAEQGDAYAQYDLGRRYFDGIGVEMNRTEAFKWYLKAAKQGHRFAMYKVGDCYYFGYGVDRDPVEAAKWYKKSKETE